MLLGMFLFCCNDALGKWLLGTYSLWQMLTIRSIAAMLILSAASSGARAGRCSTRRGRGCSSCA